MNRSIISFFLMAGLLSFSACEKFLEEELTADVSADSYYTDEQGFEDAVKAVYPAMKNFWGQEIGGTMMVFGTDTYTNGADGSWKGFNVYDSRLNAQYGYVRDLWRDFYYGINQANAVIGRAPDIEMDEGLKARRIAEARFLRALYYFTLVRTYGDVHFTLEETQGVEVEANRTPAGDIYSQGIIPDLEFAVANLPDPADQPDYGRPHTAAAKFLLAKVHLTRGYTKDAAGDDFQNAYNYMNSVIEDYDFGLLDDWGAIWDHDGELHEEVVWSIQNTSDPLLNVGLSGCCSGHRWHLYFLMEYDVLPGMLRDIENGRPWKRFKPTDFLLGLWDRSMDVRYDKGFKHVFYSNNANSIPVDDNGNPKYAVGDTAVYLPGVEWTQEEIDAARYMVIPPSQYSERRFPTLLKFLDNKRVDRQQVDGSRDFIIMRLADAYLIAAEAKHKMNMNDDAADLINIIRRRAAVDGREADMEISADQVDIDFILDERARELVGEGHRWFDLTRTGKLIERVRLHNPQAADFIQDHHALRPIPQDQIDRTQGGYPQNPGY